MNARDAAAVGDDGQEAQVLGLVISPVGVREIEHRLAVLEALEAIDGMPLNVVKPYSRILRQALDAHLAVERRGRRVVAGHGTPIV